MLSIDYVCDRQELLKLNLGKPKIASAGPFRIHLEKEKAYFYCTCGESRMQVIIT